MALLIQIAPGYGDSTKRNQHESTPAQRRRLLAAARWWWLNGPRFAPGGSLK